MTKAAGPKETPSRLPGKALPGLPPLLLLGLYVAVGLLPLVLAARGAPGPSFWRELSSGLAMVGFAMLLVQFILSGRFERVSGRVGIDLTMRLHQLAGWTVLGFILVHPFLYAAARLRLDPALALSSLERMFTAEYLRTGVAAWVLVIALVVMARWRDRLPLSYEAWRRSHGLGAMAIAALGAHHTFTAGAHGDDPVLKAFWGVAVAAALGSLVHVYVLKPLRQRRRPYRVAANERAARRMWRLAVEPERGPALDFAPGQFVWLNLGHSPFGVTEHPFSIASAPADRPWIEFIVKQDGDFTDRIGEVPVGTAAYLDGPHGNFTIAGRAPTPLVLIAGGVGFAPVLGILRHLRAEGWPHPVTVIYGNRVEDQILCRDEIEAMRDPPAFDIHLVLSEPPEGWPGPVGQLTPDVLRACLERADPAATYFVCGPPAMMDAVESALVRFGVPARRIVTERFRYD